MITSIIKCGKELLSIPKLKWWNRWSLFMDISKWGPRCAAKKLLFKLIFYHDVDEICWQQH